MGNKPAVQGTGLALCLTIFFCLSAPPASAAGERNYVILLDMSASMRDPLNGVPKYVIAREALRQLKPAFDGQSNVSLHFFANGTDRDMDAKNCLAGTQMIRNGTLITAQRIEAIAAGLEPVGHKTNITHSMLIATKELKALGGGKIILISDGEENCDLDPIKLARELKDADIQVDTIGIGPPGSFSELGRIALAAGGEFQLAQSAAGLAGALANSAPMSGAAPSAGPPPAAGGGMGIGGGGGGGGGAAGAIPAMPAPPTLPMILEKDMEVSEEPIKPVAIEVILDVSGSMAGWLEGEQKITLARRALATALAGLDEETFVVGFRAYGFDASVEKTPEASCPNTVLLAPVAANQIDLIRGVVNGLTPYGYTPLAKSLELAGQDLQAVDSDKQMIILLTDGEESCDGDPKAVAAQLRASGIDLETHIVGFDLEAEAADSMRDVAVAGGGDYYDARNAAELTNALMTVIEVSKNKVDPKWLRTISPITGGETPEDAPILTSGTYTLTDHLQKGDVRYFRVQTELAQHGVVRGLIQSKRLIRGGDDTVESISGYAQYQITIFEPDGGKIGGRYVRLFGEPGEFGHVGYSDLTGEGFLFTIGSNYDRVHKDALFNIEIIDASDQFIGLEAMDKLADASPVLAPGTPVTGHLGDGDRKDIYRAPFGAGIASATIELAFRDPEFTSRLIVRGLATKRQIAAQNSRGEPYALSFDIPASETQGLMIEIRSNNPSLRGKFSPYELSLTTEASQ